MTDRMSRLVGMAIVAIVTVACGGEPTAVVLEMDAVLEGNVLHIAGTTDLPDGALLAYEVRHERYGHDPETPEDMIFTDGTLAVASGVFHDTVNVASFDPGTIEVWVAFQMDLKDDIAQPPEIRSRFGDRGERLSGPNVTDVEDGGRRVAVVRTVER